MNVYDLILDRRSIRKFTDEKPSKEQLEKLINAAMYAPNPEDTEPWHFTVIQNQDLIDELSIETKKACIETEIDDLVKMGKNEKYNPFYNANTLIVVSARSDIKPHSLYTAGAATQNILLAAEDMGLSTCWVGWLGWLMKSETGQKYREVLNLPNGYEVLYPILVGYRYTDIPMKERNKNKVTYIY